MRAFLDAIHNGASGDEIAALPLPETYRAAFVRKDEVDMFGGMPSADKVETQAIGRGVTVEDSHKYALRWSVVLKSIITVFPSCFLPSNEASSYGF